jgi:hypothetical protein
MGFNMHKTLAALDELMQQHADSPEDAQALLSAVAAIEFIVAQGKVHAFESFLADFNTPTPLAPLHAFATREEADLWLANHPEPPHGAMVEIAGERHSVGFSRKTGLRVLVPIPPVTEQENS